MNPPSALFGAMNRERKPFTYTPGGLDLSEIKSERMAKRLMRNAMNQGVPEVPVQQIQSPPATANPMAIPNFNCLPVQVFPTLNLPANPKSLLRTRSNPEHPKEPIQRVPPPSHFSNNKLSSLQTQQSSPYESQKSSISGPQQIASYQSPITSYELPISSPYTQQKNSPYEPLKSSPYEAQISSPYEPPKSYLNEPQISSPYEPPKSFLNESQISSPYEPPNSFLNQPLISSPYEPPKSFLNQPSISSPYEPPKTFLHEPQISSPYELEKNSIYESTNNLPYEQQQSTTNELQTSVPRSSLELSTPYSSEQNMSKVQETNATQKRPESSYECNSMPNSCNPASLTNYGSDGSTAPIVLPDISYEAEYVQISPKTYNDDISEPNKSDESEQLLQQNNNIDNDLMVQPISNIDVRAASIIMPVEDEATSDSEQREVKVVKKQVKKEQKVENGDQNGDANVEAELVVKLPTKKSAAKTETKVEVNKTILPDGTVEEVKVTTTKTTIDGRTEIKTKTEKTIIPKEEVEEVEEEEEEQEETEGEVQEAEEIVEEPVVVVKKIIKESPAENGQKETIIKKEERSETSTTKKVVVVQKEESEEEEEEEEEVVEPEVVVVKKPVEKPPSPKPAEEEVTEVKEEEKEQELEQEEVVTVKVQKKEPSKQEEEEEEEVEEEYEETEEEKVVEKKEVKEEAKVVESKKEEDDESEYTEEEYESEKEEAPKQETPKETSVKEPEPEPKEPEPKEEEPAVEEKIVENKPEPEETKPEPKEEKQEEPAPLPTPAPEPKVPLREPSIPLEKVEEVEIKPIGPASEIISKTHTENTEIITNSSQQPTGPLSTQTEYSRVENIVTVNRTTKALDHSYEQITQAGIPTVRTYFAPTRERIGTSPTPSKPYQPVYAPETPTERRHSLLLDRLSTERQMPSDIYQNTYQYNNQTYDQQRQWSQEPQSEVLTVSNVKPSKITNSQWYQQNNNVIYNNVTPAAGAPPPAPTPAPASQPWSQPSPQQQYQPPPQQQYQPPPQQQYQPPPQQQYQPPPQAQYQPSYIDATAQEMTTTNNYQSTNTSYPGYVPKPTNWVNNDTSSINTNLYSLSNNTTESYQKSTQQYSSSYVPPPWEQDSSNYVLEQQNTNQNYYQPPPQSSNYTPSPNQGWKPTPPPAKFSKPPPTAYIPPAPNQSFVKSANAVELPRVPGRKTYYSEYERRYITVPESTYIPSDTAKFQVQPDPSPQYYYDNNEPTEKVEHEWRKELREFTEKSSQIQTTDQTSIKPPWEDDNKYAKAPSAYTPTPTWSQTLRPRSWRERSFEAEYVGSQEPPKTNTLGRGRPLSTYAKSETPIPERARGVSVDRYNPNNYHSPIPAEHPPVQSHTLTPTPPAAKAYHNPNVPAYHAHPRASAEPREQSVPYPQARLWGSDARGSPIQSRSFKYLQWITGTDE